MNRIYLVPIIPILFAFGCGDSEKKTFVDICKHSTTRLKAGMTTNILQAVDNALLSCSNACDLDHDRSCSLLDDVVAKFCSIEPKLCKDTCNEGKSESLKKAACRHVPAR